MEVGQSSEVRCWVCNSANIRTARDASYSSELHSDDFAITDARYGTTHAICECLSCGFLFCPYAPEVLPFYEELVDEAYESSRGPRELQAKQLVNQFQNGLSRIERACLLDVGAGSGILVEQAQNAGFQAVGVEPSQWLAAVARERKLQVHCGVLPLPELEGQTFQVVSLVDVIEHVSDPLDLLREIRPLLSEDGRLFVITPDVSSVAARILGWRWWHYRLAHISYFDRHTLERLLNVAGFEVMNCSRPGWYFSLDYLVQRLNQYLPDALEFPVFQWMRSLRIPLNLRDSFMLVARPAESGPVDGSAIATGVSFD